MKYAISIWKVLSDSTDLPSAQKKRNVKVNWKEIGCKLRILIWKFINIKANIWVWKCNAAVQNSLDINFFFNLFLKLDNIFFWEVSEMGLIYKLTQQ